MASDKTVGPSPVETADAGSAGVEQVHIGRRDDDHPKVDAAHDDGDGKGHGHAVSVGTGALAIGALGVLTILAATLGTHFGR